MDRLQWIGFIKGNCSSVCPLQYHKLSSSSYQASLILSLGEKCQIQGLQIVNNGSAFIEVLVSNTNSHGQSGDYQVEHVSFFERLCLPDFLGELAITDSRYIHFCDYWLLKVIT